MIESQPYSSNTTSRVQSNEPASAEFESALFMVAMKSTTHKLPLLCAGSANCKSKSSDKSWPMIRLSVISYPLPGRKLALASQRPAVECDRRSYSRYPDTELVCVEFRLAT